MGVGRKPKPTEIKRLEGNPGKRPLNENEPKYKGRPACPVWLSKEGKAEWKRIVPELDKVGLLQSVDRAALAGYCASWAKFKAAEEVLQLRGTTFVVSKHNRDGDIVSTYYAARPEMAMSNQAILNILRFCSEFGFTPSSRTRLAINTVKATKGIGELLD